jgi:hypothetical protein
MRIIFEPETIGLNLVDAAIDRYVPKGEFGIEGWQYTRFRVCRAECRISDFGDVMIRTERLTDRDGWQNHQTFTPEALHLVAFAFAKRGR